MHTPKVSILFPIYNVELYLREAIDSLLDQTFTDFELICLDDCSPDNSAEILDSYSDPRIVRYRGEKNQGLANVLNVGMDMARGEYIARMDSDDISLPNRLQIQVNYLDSHPDIDLCSCAIQLFGGRQDVWVRDANPEAVKFRALFHSPILHASSMWRRERFANLRFEQATVPAEDYDLWTRALLNGLKMVNLPDVLYRYRIFDGQATSQNEKVKLKTDAVREEYIRQAFPSATEKLVHQAAQIDNLSPVDDTLKNVLQNMIETNRVNHFFDATFDARCKRYYQGRLFSYMKENGVAWRLLWQLRLSQIVKLMIH